MSKQKISMVPQTIQADPLASFDPNSTVDRFRHMVRNELTLEGVLNASPVRDFGKEGNLSERQRGLVASVVSVMQDQIIDLLRSEAELLADQIAEQRRLTSEVLRSATFGLVVGLRQAWSAPLITRDPASSAPAPGGSLQRSWLRSVASYLNWGNFATVAAVLLVGVALYFTKAYSSYKDRAENQAAFITELSSTRDQQEKRIKELEGQLTGAKEESAKLSEDLAVANARAETAQARIKDLQTGVASAGDLQDQLNAAAAKLTEQTAKAAANEQKAVGARNDADTYRRLRNEEKERADRAEKNSFRLESENQKLKAELETLRRKQ